MDLEEGNIYASPDPTIKYKLVVSVGDNGIILFIK